MLRAAGPGEDATWSNMVGILDAKMTAVKMKRRRTAAEKLDEEKSRMDSWPSGGIE